MSPKARTEPQSESSPDDAVSPDSVDALQRFLKALTEPGAPVGALCGMTGENFADFFQFAYTSLHAGRHDLGRKVFDSLNTLWPGQPKFELGLARAHAMAKELEPALHWVETYLTHAEDEPAEEQKRARALQDELTKISGQF